MGVESLIWQQLGSFSDHHGTRASKNLKMHRQIIITVDHRLKEIRKHVGDDKTAKRITGDCRLWWN